MPMDRRGILKGLGAASIGGSAIFGSGALTQLSSARTVSVNVTNDNSSVISLSAGSAADGIGTIEEGSNGQLSFTLSNINADSQLVIGDAPSNDPTSDTISDSAFTISDNLGSDALDSDEAIAVEVEVSGSGSASGLGLVFLATDNTDDLANYLTTGYTQSDQDSVAGANLQNRGTDIAALPSRYDTENDSAKFLLDKESTVGAELILQADADDLDSDPSFDITITAQPVDAPADLTSSHIGMNVSQLTDSSTATHELEVTNNYSSAVTAGISISEQGLSVSQSGVSIASGTTTTVEIDAAHLDTITPTVDATNDSTGNTVTAQQQLTVPGSASGGAESIRVEDGNTLYDVHAFTSVGQSSFEPTESITADALIVGGGGAGGANDAGGGGAGGLIYETGISADSSSAPYTVTVGDGGTGVEAVNMVSGNNGENSSAFDLTAIGGGGGGRQQVEAPSGGSGGGAGHDVSSPGSALQPTSADGGFGNPGGDSTDESSPYPGGGGGGAGEAGESVFGGQSDSKGGDGGRGKDYSTQFGTTFGEDDGNGTAYFAGGGGGGIHDTDGDHQSSSGGLGGGGYGGVGDGSTTDSARSPEDGRSNTGGGGGGTGNAGSGQTSGAGGSGIVLIRYPVQ